MIVDFSEHNSFINPKLKRNTCSLQKVNDKHNTSNYNSLYFNKRKFNQTNDDCLTSENIDMNDKMSCRIAKWLDKYFNALFHPSVAIEDNSFETQLKYYPQPLFLQYHGHSKTIIGFFIIIYHYFLMQCCFKKSRNIWLVDLISIIIISFHYKVYFYFLD
jgi:hypothetical protein